MKLTIFLLLGLLGLGLGTHLTYRTCLSNVNSTEQFGCYNRGVPSAACMQSWNSCDSGYIKVAAVQFIRSEVCKLAEWTWLCAPDLPVLVETPIPDMYLYLLPSSFCTLFGLLILLSITPTSCQEDAEVSDNDNDDVDVDDPSPSPVRLVDYSDSSSDSDAPS